MNKVLHLVSELTFGGACRVAVAVAKYSIKLGKFHHSLSTIRPGALHPEAASAARAQGVELLPTSSWDELKALFSQFDLIHLHWWNEPAVNAFLTTELPACRLIGWCHVGGSSLPQVVTPEITSFFDRAVGCAPVTMESPGFQHPCAQNSTMIFAGADLSRIQLSPPTPHSTINVSYIGTVDFLKMHPRYIAMCAQVKNPKVHFHVCGQGADRATLSHQAAEQHLQDRVHLLGYVEDISSLLAQTDIYGYPLSEDTYAASELNLQEAMYAGVPPVVFPHGGIKYLVHHGVTGLVVHTEAEYAQAIEYLAQSPEERIRLGRNAQLYAKEAFGAERAAQLFDALYNELLNEPLRKRSPLKIPPSPYRGAATFVSSLGESTPTFRQALLSQEEEQILKAEEGIRKGSLLTLRGGLAPYTSYFKEDALLPLWLGLSYQGKDEPATAIEYFTKAFSLGLQHWRIYWYIAQSAIALKEYELAENMLTEVLKARPTFSPAIALKNSW